MASFPQASPPTPNIHTTNQNLFINLKNDSAYKKIGIWQNMDLIQIYKLFMNILMWLIFNKIQEK